MAQFYSLLDALVIPSRDEGGPMAFLEAWASGVPVISTRTGMPADMIKSKENGILVNIEDPQAIADNLMLLMKDAELKQSLATSALSAFKTMDWSSVSQLYYQLLYK